MHSHPFRHLPLPCFVVTAVVLSTRNACAGMADPIAPIHVDANLRTGAADGTSWADAFRGPLALRDALASIAPGRTAEMWITDGTYVPALHDEPMATSAS